MQPEQDPTPSLGERIKVALHDLIGLTLVRAGRAVDLFWFVFATSERVGEANDALANDGDYAIHVQCAWRLADRSRIIVASLDRFFPPGDPYREVPGFEWVRPGANRCDQRLRELFEPPSGNPLKVTGVGSDDVGGVEMYLSRDITFSVFPDNSFESEHWRLLPPEGLGPHFVVEGTATGIRVLE